MFFLNMFDPWLTNILLMLGGNYNCGIVSFICADVALIIRVYSSVVLKPTSFTATCVRSGGDVRFPA